MLIAFFFLVCFFFFLGFLRCYWHNLLSDYDREEGVDVVAEVYFVGLFVLGGVLGERVGDDLCVDEVHRDQPKPLHHVVVDKEERGLCRRGDLLVARLDDLLCADKVLCCHLVQHLGLVLAEVGALVEFLVLDRGWDSNLENILETVLICRLLIPVWEFRF